MRSRRMKGPVRALVALTAVSLLVSAGCAAGRTAPTRDRVTARKKPPTVVKKDRPRLTEFVQEGFAGHLPQDGPAAHKTLPLGVYVKVRNLSTGREAVVRIGERGPMISGRIIDLAPSVAKRLGFGTTGTAQVRIIALGEKVKGKGGKATYRALDNYDAGSFAVHVRACTDPNSAKRLAEEIGRLFGYSEFRSTTAGAERYYRVLAGRYDSLREAEKAAVNFSEHGYPGSFVLALD